MKTNKTYTTGVAHQMLAALNAAGFDSDDLWMRWVDDGDLIAQVQWGLFEELMGLAQLLIDIDYVLDHMAWKVNEIGGQDMTIETRLDMINKVAEEIAK